MAAANPFDQFDAPKQAANPFDQFDAKATSVKPSTPAPTTNSSAVSFLTSPQFANESLLQEAKDVGLSVGDYLALGQGGRIASALGAPSIGDMIARAHQNLGYADYGIGAGSYLLGPGKILGPAAKLAGMGGLGTAALEGAMAGGISGFDPNAPISSPLTGAAGGAALGGAAHGLGNVAGVVANKFAPQVDAAAAVAATKAARDQAYAPLQNITFHPNTVEAAYNVTLPQGMSADVSDGMNSVINKQLRDFQDGGPVSADAIATYAKNLRDSVSPNSSNGDRVMANQVADNLENGVLGNAQPTSAHAPGDAASILSDAKQAHQQYAMAQALKEWQDNLANFKVSPGAAPMQQAQYYKPGSAEFNTLADLYKSGADSSSGMSYPLTHMAAEGAEALGAAAGLSGVGVAGVGAAAHLAKLPIKSAANWYKRAKLAQAIQGAYPTLTGTPTPPSVAAPAGDLIRGLMLSQGAQYGV